MDHILNSYISIYDCHNFLPTSILLKSIKVKLSLCYALRHEDVFGSECIDPCILDLGPCWKLVVSFTSLPLCPRRSLYRTLGGPQNRSGRCGGEKNLAPAEASCYTNCAIVAIVQFVHVKYNLKHNAGRR
jgi:hypothetical protein